MKNNYSTLSNTYNSKQPPIIYQPEVFYYNNGNLGFSFEDARNFEYTNDWNWQIASPQQILDSYEEGADIDCSDNSDIHCLWGWGLNGIQYAFSRSTASFYNRKSNENCGIFLYGIKPNSSYFPNCLKTTNQACMLPWCNDKNQWSKYSSLPITCYTEGENPFQDKCSKSSCCDGTTLRLHPPDDTHKKPYYICSSNQSYKQNIPKCDPKTTNPACLNSFCSFFNNEPEVFYYNNGNLGFTFDEAKDIASTKQWQIATVTQIWDAYQDSADINTCMWGWGHDGFKYWFTRKVGILCGEATLPGFYYEQAGDNEKCGIFFYGFKPSELDYPNCLTTKNQACMLPWDGINQWSKYSSPCYTEGENPFQDKCSKSSCCDNTTLRLHPPDAKNKEPYYICSSNPSYSPSLPKCDPKTTNSDCFNSSFCQ